MKKLLQALTKKLVARYQRKQLAQRKELQHQRFLNILEQTRNI